MISFLYFTVLTFFVFLCTLLCFIIMIQESKNAGLGAAFGGDASSSLFGTSTADVLKKITAWMAAIFLASCVLLSVWTAAMGRSNHPAATTADPYSIEQS